MLEVQLGKFQVVVDYRDEVPVFVVLLNQILHIVDYQWQQVELSASLRHKVARLQLLEAFLNFDPVKLQVLPNLKKTIFFDSTGEEAEEEEHLRRQGSRRPVV